MKKSFSIKKFFDPNSLRFQLLSRSLFFLAIILLFIGLFQYVFMREFVYTSTASSIKSQIVSVPREVWTQMLIYTEISGKLNGGNIEGALIPENDQNKDPNKDPNKDKEPNRVPFNLMDSTIAFVDSQGNVTPLVNVAMKAGPPPKLELQEYEAAIHPARSINYKVVVASDGDEKFVVLHPLESRGYIVGLIQVSLSTKFLKTVLYRQLFIFLLLSLLALVGGLLAFHAVLKKTLIPLSNIGDTVERIDAGNLAERLPVEQGQMEIDRLAVSFNGMLERLESSFEAEKEAKEQMRRFVADASHELRTPLTSIHGFLEVLLRGAMNQPEKLNKSLKSMYTESERMKKLIQDLLLLAKLDRSPNMEFIERDLASLILEMETQLRMLAGNREVDLELTPETYVRFDVDKMKQIILNLFNNAVQHTDPETGQIKLLLKPVEDGVELAVKDNGTGISEEHIPHLFERFYRSESSRTRKYGGAGLGLAITQSLVELHGGSIQVESRVGEGSIFYILLPRQVDEKDD
jgi:two-component system, OmpR family, sensor kinase